MNTEPANTPETTPPPPPPAPAPPVLPGPPPRPARGKKLLAVLLSGFLGLVVINAAVSVLDDSCGLLFGSHVFTGLSGLILFFSVLAAVLVYGLMGLTPLVPKRFFLPAVFLILGPFLIILPLLIYFFSRLLLMDWIVSCAEVIIGLLILRWAAGGWKFRWPLVAERHLDGRGFSWGNLLVFVLLNVLVLLPAVAVYLAVCTALAVSHFTGGFMALRPNGIVMQARKYVRNDGRTVILFPMSHIAESDFYRSVAGNVDSNTVVLLEGVSDTQNLITNKLSYRRAAKKLHLAEQHDDFDLPRGKLVSADVDVHDFSSNTIAILNLSALIHTQGLTMQNLSLLLQCNPSEEVERQLFDDLLWKRNQHVLHELFTRLPESDTFIIPWGAAHMAGLSEEIEKAGFRPVATRNFVSIRFGGKKRPGDEGGNGWVPLGAASQR